MAWSVTNKAHKIRQQHFDEAHPKIANSLNTRPNIRVIQGLHTEAERMYVKSLTILEKVLGPNHPKIATSLINLASLYRQQDKVELIEELY